MWPSSSWPPHPERTLICVSKALDNPGFVRYVVPVQHAAKVHLVVSMDLATGHGFLADLILRVDFLLGFFQTLPVPQVHPAMYAMLYPIRKTV